MLPNKAHNDKFPNYHNFYLFSLNYLVADWLELVTMRSDKAACT